MCGKWACETCLFHVCHALCINWEAHPCSCRVDKATVPWCRVQSMSGIMLEGHKHDWQSLLSIDDGWCVSLLIPCTRKVLGAWIKGLCEPWKILRVWMFLLQDKSTTNTWQQCTRVQYIVLIHSSLCMYMYKKKISRIWHSMVHCVLVN